MKAVLETLARFELAAGKFPQAAQMCVRIALGNEQLAVTKNQGGGDDDGVHGGQRGVVRIAWCVLRVSLCVFRYALTVANLVTQHATRNTSPRPVHRPTLL